MESPIAWSKRGKCKDSSRKGLRMVLSPHSKMRGSGDILRPADTCLESIERDCQKTRKQEKRTAALRGKPRLAVPHFALCGKDMPHGSCGYRLNFPCATPRIMKVYSPHPTERTFLPLAVFPDPRSLTCSITTPFVPRIAASCAYRKNGRTGL